MLEKYVDRYDLAKLFDSLAERKRVLFERSLGKVPSPERRRDSLCDVGCADGQFLELAASLGWRTHGVELNPPAAARARARGARVFEGLFEKMEDLSWGTYDLVTCWDVLEHTPEPRLFAERLVRLARPGGTILLTTLNRDSLVFKAFGMRWSMVVEDHFTYWNRRSLDHLFSTLDCDILDRDSFGVGRDFVAWIDSVQSRGRRLALGRGEVGNDAQPRPWDINWGILRVEEVVNTGLRATGAGVAIGLTLRRP